MWKNISVFEDAKEHVKKYVFEDAKEHVKKYVFEKDDICIESVLYRYPTYSERTVLCISTMCGCPIGCRFCGTGDYFVRSLTSDEIIGQVSYILESQIGGIDPLSIEKLQIMVMSMGEPLLVKSLELAFHRLYNSYPNAQLLISSSAPDIDYDWVIKLSKDIPTVGLQFSIHESTDIERNKLIPFKKKLNLQQISDIGKLWYYQVGRKPFFNYCAHDSNSSDEDVNRLHELFNPNIWNATVSVICERNEFESASNEYQRNLAIDFGNKLVDIGYDVRVFDPAGQDQIGGGCGQLWYVQDWMKDNPKFAKPSCGNGLQKIHAPMLDKKIS